MALELAPIKNELPLLYRWLRANGLKRLVPWHFGDDAAFIAAWRKEYFVEVGGTSDILPFAFRQDTDTMAGFVVVDGMALDRVMTTHLSFVGRRDMPWLRDGEQPAPFNLNQLPSFSSWFTKVMVADSVEWMNEEDLVEMKAGTWPAFAR